MALTLAQPVWRTGSPHHSTPARERMATGATLITLIRTAASGVLAFHAARVDSLPWLLWALAVYWIGDMADGACARYFDHETRFGAVLDIVCDRFNAGAFYLGLGWLRPELAWPIALYVAEFMTVDTVNSLAFLAWPTRSPNYFYEVDRPVWLLNWSKPAKAANSAIFAILLILTGWVWLGFLIAGVMWLVKLWTLRRIMAIGLPLPTPGPRTGADA
ncbi:CDP-alcohol phosphatidyltransferase family protein [Luteococcus sp. H138]|uniref:CDP-alcohol phosphatidyltransferase family protein n=1 Tax=unclassified Luteococcus TaxID=2639923 RepID=UPI00313CA8D5